MPTLMPPPQYDVPPPMPVIEFVLPQSEVQRICEERIARNPPGFLARPMMTQWELDPAGKLRRSTVPVPMKWQGCNGISRFNAVCVVWRIADDAVRRHEWAHCAGWPGAHPGGIELRDSVAAAAPVATVRMHQPEGRSALDAIGDALVSGMTRR